MILSDLIAKAQCYLWGHKRGKRVSDIDGLITYRCDRCGVQWMRKARKPKEA